jgi:glycosyltransferase involved in cell wall biosynthesis
MKECTSKEIKEFVSKPLFDEDIILNKDSNYPKISIVTPSYNQAQFLERTILSVLNQNYPNLEYIIIDGGSTDGSVDIIKKYEKYLYYWQSCRDSGQPEAINFGLKKASGEIFTFLNSDDIFLPNLFEYIAEFSIKKVDINVFFGHHLEIDVADRIIRKCYHPPWFSWIAWRSMPYIAQPGTFFRSEIWRQVKGVDESLQCVFDYDLWYRFMNVTAHFGHLRIFTAGFRIHSNSKGQAIIWKQRYENERNLLHLRYRKNISKFKSIFARFILIAMQILLFNYQKNIKYLLTRWIKKE